MIENTYDNREKLAKLVVDNMDEKDLKYYAEQKIWSLLDRDYLFFETELKILGIANQEELNIAYETNTQGELDGDNCPVIGGFPLPEDIDE